MEIHHKVIWNQILVFFWGVGIIFVASTTWWVNVTWDIQFNVTFWIQTCVRVESPIIEHLPIIKQFSIFFYSFTKLNDFCGMGCTNWRVTNIFSPSEVKKKKGMSDNLFQFNLIYIIFRPLFSSKAIISSFLVWFEWCKTYGCAN